MIKNKLIKSYRYSNALFITIFASLAISMFLNLIKSYIVIDLPSFIKAGVGIVTSLIISIFFKSFLDIKNQISNFSLPDATPIKISNEISESIQHFSLNQKYHIENIKFSITLLFFFVLSFVQIQEHNDLTFFIENFFVFSFVIFSTYSVLHLKNQESKFKHFLRYLKKIEAIEQERIRMIDKLTKIRTEYKNSNSGFKTNKTLSLKDLIDAAEKKPIEETENDSK